MFEITATPNDDQRCPKGKDMDIAYILMKLSIQQGSHSPLPGWTGFNTMLCDPKTLCNIGYLPFIDPHRNDHNKNHSVTKYCYSRQARIAVHCCGILPGYLLQGAANTLE